MADSSPVLAAAIKRLRASRDRGWDPSTLFLSAEGDAASGNLLRAREGASRIESTTDTSDAVKTFKSDVNEKTPTPVY